MDEQVGGISADAAANTRIDAPVLWNDQRNCTTPESFIREVLPAFQQKCLNCHNLEGVARNSNLTLLRGEGNTDDNFLLLHDYASDHPSRLLDKSIGLASHAGGNLYQHNASANYLALQTFTQSSADACSEPDNANAPKAIATPLGYTEDPVPLTIDFTGEDSEGDISGFRWNFGDGNHAKGAEATHTYNRIGTYISQLTVTASDGQSSISKIPIFVNEPVGAVDSRQECRVLPSTFEQGIWPSVNEGCVSCHKNGAIAGSTALIFRDNNADLLDNYNILRRYAINSSAKLLGRSIGLPTHSGGAPFVDANSADYVRLEQGMTRLLGNCQQPIIIGPIIYEPGVSVITTSSATTGSDPLTINFSGADSSGDIASFRWDFGDGQQADGIAATHTYTSAGIYIARLHALDMDDNSSSSELEITVNETVTAAAPAVQCDTVSNTFTQSIFPLLESACSGCHSDFGIAASSGFTLQPGQELESFNRLRNYAISDSGKLLGRSIGVPNHVGGAPLNSAQDASYLNLKGALSELLGDCPAPP
jgi:PKD repeat protein